MFERDSRYAGQPIVTFAAPDGSEVAAVLPPRPRPAPIVGYHPTAGGARLDLLATQYLAAPTGFWRLCDANDAMLASSLAARALIGIPGIGA